MLLATDPEGGAASQAGNGLAHKEVRTSLSVGGNSPTSRSLAKLRSEGWLAEVVERWIPQANIRKDLFGFGDILAVRDEDRLIVQTTSESNLSARVRKIAGHENVAAVRKAGFRIVVHGWGKRGGRWRCREVDCS